MTLVVIGAGGFLGSEVLRQAVAGRAGGRLRAVDLALAPASVPAGVEVIEGNMADPRVMARALDGATAVIHLASVLGGAAEADPAGARRVNVDATLDMLDHLRATNPGARFVFASSIAVLGHPLTAPVDDASIPQPQMVYGLHKLMVEEALSHAARRGWVDGIALRPAGIVARDGMDAALRSAFLSRLFWGVARGEDLVLPVGPEDRSWFASVRSVAAAFLHAASMPTLPARRALTLPALDLSFGQVIAALRRRFPDSPSRITHQPDPELVALFGRFPALTTDAATAAGFPRDVDADALVANALSGAGRG